MRSGCDRRPDQHELVASTTDVVVVVVFETAASDDVTNVDVVHVGSEVELKTLDVATVIAEADVVLMVK